jgi:TonB family protein
MKAAAILGCAFSLVLGGWQNGASAASAGPTESFGENGLVPTSQVLPKSQNTCPHFYNAGLVKLAFTVKPDGSVSDIKVAGESPRNCGFASDAIFAFRYWKFPPRVVNGTAVPYQGVYTVAFQSQYRTGF